MKPMKLTDVSLSSAEKYLTDPAWVLEQKFDGARALVIAEYVVTNPMDSREDELIFHWISSGGGELKFAAAVQHFKSLEPLIESLMADNDLDYLVLDGELMIDTGTLRVFDLPGFIGLYDERRGALETLFEKVNDENLVLVYQARTEDDKRALWSQINTRGVEGAVAKRLDADYEQGVRATHQVKLKLVKTADVVVTKVERTFKPDGKTVHKGSAELAVIIQPEDDPTPYVDAKGKRVSLAFIEAHEAKGKLVKYEYHPRETLHIGSSSLIGKDLTIDVGSVVECAYLYWTGSSMVQPRILRKREPIEKVPAQCDLEQFPEYSRKAVEV